MREEKLKEVEKVEKQKTDLAIKNLMEKIEKNRKK